MSGKAGTWQSKLALFYYIAGSVYYAYHWLIILGVATLVLSAIGISRNWGPTIAASLVSFSFWFLALGLAFLYRRAKRQLMSKNPGLKIKSIRVTYRVNGDNSCWVLKEITCKAVFPVNQYEFKMNWSGDGSYQVDTLTNVRSVEVREDPFGHGKIGTAEFSRHLSKTDEYTFSYSLKLQNPSKTLKPYLGQGIDGDIEELQLKVRLPTSNGGRSYTKELFLNKECTQSLWYNENKADGPTSNEFDWSIPKPRPGHYYRLSWVD